MALGIYTSAAFTANGGVDPASSAEVEVLDESTGNLATIYSDRAGNTTKTNPFNADAQGRFEFYAAGGAYQVTVTDDDENADTVRYQAIGTAQEHDTGSDADQVPTNADIDSRGFAEVVDSVAALQAASFPEDLERLWLAGYTGKGTAGGGPMYRDSDDTSTADNGNTVIVDSDGVRWKADNGFTIAETFDINIPDEFSTLQDAIDFYSRFHVVQGVELNLLIASGHTLTAGVSVSRGNYGHFVISSVDEVVPTGFNAHFLRAVRNAVAPGLNTIIDHDFADELRNGYFCSRGSRGFVEAGAGVINARNNIRAEDSSHIACDGCIANGARRSGIIASRASTISADNSEAKECVWGVDFGDSERPGSIYAGRNSLVSANSSNADDSFNKGYVARHGSSVFCNDSTALNAALNGIEAEFAGTVAARNADVSNSNSGVWATDESHIDFNGGTATGCAHIGVAVIRGGRVNINDATITGNSSDDIRVRFGGVVSAGTSGTSYGTTNVTVNTLHPEGIIFDENA